MRIAICPGSFDPITYGHLDVIKRAAKLFDEVIVLISVNPTKKRPTFSPLERKEMIDLVIKDMPNVKSDVLEGLLADYVEKVGAVAIVKGLRAVSDFEYEFQMALTNKNLNPKAETIFLTTTSEFMFLSSSVVRQVAYFNGDISKFVPPEIQSTVIERIRKKEKEQ